MDIIAGVRRRWRMKLALRGLVRAGAVVVVLGLAAAYLIDWARFAPGAIMAARIVLPLAAVAALLWFVVRPLRQRVTDDQVALYLEEHEPSLQATLVSAVESTRRGHPVESSALVQRVVEQAVEACDRMDSPRRADRAPLRGYGAGLALGGVIALALVMAGPAFIRSALSAMFVIAGVEAAAPYQIVVTPGNQTVPKGSDQTVTAKLIGFRPEEATLLVRRTPGGEFEPLPLVRADNGNYEGMIFDINAPLDYVVEAEGMKSQQFTFAVVDLPYAERIELEYHFPAYASLEPQKIEDGGDIAVLTGTEVRVRVVPTMKTEGGRLALHENETVALTAQADGSLTGAFKATRDGFYRVELTAPNGAKVVGSPQYTIDVLTDQAPSVSFSKPGRDSSASAIEEVFLEAKAEDDFGIKDLELVYSVNGGPENTVKLYQGTKRLPEVAAGHTLYMEELGVAAGDSVSYYARAVDNDAVGGGKTTTSDLYFLRVRPFSKDFRQAQSQGGGGGGGGGGGQIDALSQQQQQVIAATFNIQRDRKTFTPEKFRQSATVVELSQSRLREQVEGLLTRMNSQLVERDPAFAKIAELLPQAVTAMKEAEGKLAAASPETALPPEHKALQILQKAEEEYELQVSAGQQGGGGGGGGAMQQELAEIFDQELDKMASRYETASQSSQEQADREVDELLEKLKELARRQQQEAERQRRASLQNQLGNSGGGGGGNAGGSSSAQQRALAEQAEEAARRLERLAREEQRPELMDSARELRAAADAMRRAAAGGDANASAQAQAALERLRETERRLQRGLSARAERDVQDAKRQADDIAREQAEIAGMTQQLQPNGPGRQAQGRAINERKESLESKLGELESRLDRAARDAANDERAASRKMAEAAGAIRDNRLQDKVRFSRQMVNRASPQSAIQALESDVAGGIEDVRRRLDEAAAALGQGATPENRQDQALDRARRLARAAESMQERTRERAQLNGRDGQGREGDDQQGQGQGGRDGQQQARNGQQGQRGQQGQQGQGQQGQGQQGEGQGQGQGEGQQGEGGGQGGDGAQQAGGGANGGARTGAADGGFANGGGVDRGGVWNGGWGGWWNGGPVRLTPEDVRQLRGELREFANDARDLRGMLRGQDIDPSELEQVLSNLRQLEDDRIYQNVAELARLQQAVAEGLKRFEFGLRQKVEGDVNRAALSGSDEVPVQFRALVEQYYRSLARTPR